MNYTIVDATPLFATSLFATSSLFTTSLFATPSSEGAGRDYMAIPPTRLCVSNNDCGYDSDGVKRKFCTCATSPECQGNNADTCDTCMCPAGTCVTSNIECHYDDDCKKASMCLYTQVTCTSNDDCEGDDNTCIDATDTCDIKHGKCQPMKGALGTEQPKEKCKSNCQCKSYKCEKKRCSNDANISHGFIFCPKTL